MSLSIRRSFLAAAALALASAGILTSTTSAQAATTLNLSYLGLSGAGVTIDGNQYLAQVFVPTESGPLTAVVLGLSDVNQLGAVDISIESVDNSHQPTGTVLAVESLDNSGVVDWPTVDYIDMSFTSPPVLVAGTEYAIVLSSPSGDFAWSMSDSPYLSGQSLVYSSGRWSDWTGTFSFATYMDVAAAQNLQSPPPAMQQVGLPLAGNCAAITDTSLNWGGSQSGGWGSSWAQWMNDGHGGAVCTRTLVWTSTGRWTAQG